MRRQEQSRGKERRLAIHDAEGKYVRGVALLEGQELEDVGETLPEEHTATEVEELPVPTQGTELDRITALRTATREEFAELILEEARTLVHQILNQEVDPSARKQP